MPPARLQMLEEAEPVTPVERAHEEEEQEEEVSQTPLRAMRRRHPLTSRRHWREARVPLPLLRGCTCEVPRASVLFRFLTAAQ